MGAAGCTESDGVLGRAAAGSVNSLPPRPAAAMALSGLLWQQPRRGGAGAEPQWRRGREGAEPRWGRGFGGGGHWTSRAPHFGELMLWTVVIPGPSLSCS